MGLRGNLATMQLPDVLQWISMGRKTGVLEVVAARGVTKRVWTVDGAVSAVASSEPREFFGQFLLSRGVLSENQLRLAMETQAATKIKLGRILVRVGILEEAALQDLLTLKAQEGVYDLFLWDEGDFHFEEQPAPAGDEVPIALDVMGLVMEGIRRKDEWERLRAVIKNWRAIFEKVGELDAAPSITQDTGLARFLEAVDGVRSLEEISLNLRSGEFQVSCWAYQLLTAGLLKQVGESPERNALPQGLVPALLLQEAERIFAQGRKEEAAIHARWALSQDPYNPLARTLLEKAEAGFAEAFFQEVAPRNAVPELGVPLAHLQGYDLSPQEGFLVTRVNGSWDIAAILQVSPIAPTETLRALKRLLGMGILHIKGRS